MNTKIVNGPQLVTVALYVCTLTLLNIQTTGMQSVINDMPELATRVLELSMLHMLIDMPDVAEANLLPHFQQAVQFITSALGGGGKVLVHCQAGVSRSASVSPVLLTGALIKCQHQCYIVRVAGIMSDMMIAGATRVSYGNRKSQCGICTCLCQTRLSTRQPQ